MSKKWLIVAAVVIVVAALGLVYFRRIAAQGAATEASLETVPVRRGTLVATVSASGSIAPKAQATLTFKTPGLVAEVNVEEGDRVEAGEVLARLETKDLELAVAQAEASLAQAEAQLKQIEKGPSAHDLAAAEASLASAEANLARLLAGPDEREIEMARLSWEQAKNNLWAAQAERDGIAGNKMNPGYMVDAANARVAAAEIAARIAELQYEQAKAGPDEYEVAIAQAQVDQAQAALDKLKSSPTPEELAIARAQVDQARAALAQARLRLEEAVLVAPFAGTVASVDVNVGELASSAKPAIVLVDLSALHLDITVDEIDIGRIEVGQEVNIALDAFPDVELKGRVTRIDPVGTVVQGVVTYGVRIELEPTEVPIRPGMTANVDILVERREEVLLVPNRALRRDGRGKYVEVLAGGQRQRRYVTTGLSDGAFTEVIEGLKEGERVIVSASRRNVFEEGGGLRFPFGRR